MVLDNVHPLDPCLPRICRGALACDSSSQQQSITPAYRVSLDSDDAHNHKDDCTEFSGILLADLLSAMQKTPMQW